MKGNISWPAVLLVVVKALLAGLAAITADQLAGQPVADALRHAAPAALGRVLPASSVSSSSLLVHPLYETSKVVSA